MHNVTIVDGYICQKKQIDLCNAVIKCCSGRTPPLSWQGSGSVFELWPVRLTRVKCNKTNAGRELWGRGPVECLAKCNKTKVRLTLLSQLLLWAVTLLKALFFSVFCPGGLVASCGFNLSVSPPNGLIILAPISYSSPSFFFIEKVWSPTERYVVCSVNLQENWMQKKNLLNHPFSGPDNYFHKN